MTAGQLADRLSAHFSRTDCARIAEVVEHATLRNLYFLAHVLRDYIAEDDALGIEQIASTFADPAEAQRIRDQLDVEAHGDR